MSRKKADPNDKLSPLGKQVERTLTKLLKDVMAEPAKGADTFTLTDKMKVLDRALKLEAIKAKVSDDEGSFFNRNKEGVEDE